MNNYNDFIEQSKRIASVFKTDKVPLVNPRSLEIYMEYLGEKMTFPCDLTGIEDFDWEEYYVLGGGDPDEYEELKKTNPSYTDTFKLTGFKDLIHEQYGIVSKVKRIVGKNKKHFFIELDRLKCTDISSANHQLIRDYAVWFVNFN